MRFLRHRGIYQSDVRFCFARFRAPQTRSGVPPPDRERASSRSCPRSRSPSTLKSRGLRARTKLKDMQEEHALAHHRLDEFRPANPRIGLLASRARLRFTGHDQHKTIAGPGERIYHRTVNSVLTVCLSQGAHPTGNGRDLLVGQLFQLAKH
jgi:hypothetical protein